jgi:Asp-tRNA(Asn)/Glu-tRNA(Gln) amidotransferase A subunit family amidase
MPAPQARIASDLLPRWRYEMEPFVVHLLERGLSLSAARLYRCNLVAGDMYKTLAPILDKYNILICPTTAVPSVKAEHRNDDRLHHQWKESTRLRVVDSHLPL